MFFSYLFINIKKIKQAESMELMRYVSLQFVEGESQELERLNQLLYAKKEIRGRNKISRLISGSPSHKTILPLCILCIQVTEIILNN